MDYFLGRRINKLELSTSIPSVIIPLPTRCGSFQIFVSSIDTSGANAIFLICNNDNNSNCTRLSSCMGSLGESLNVQMDSDNKPRLQLFNIQPPEGFSNEYMFKVVHV
jgi:hypothetical protein